MPFIYHPSEKDELMAGLMSQMRGGSFGLQGFLLLDASFSEVGPGPGVGFPGLFSFVYRCARRACLEVSLQVSCPDEPEFHLPGLDRHRSLGLVFFFFGPSPFKPKSLHFVYLVCSVNQ